MEAGWTVAAVPAHAAFWDQRIVVLLDQWEQRGPSWTPPLEEERDGDWINDAAKALRLALPRRVAADLAVSVAEAVDRRVAAVSDAIIEANARAGSPSTGTARSTGASTWTRSSERSAAPDPPMRFSGPPGETAENELCSENRWRRRSIFMQQGGPPAHDRLCRRPTEHASQGSAMKGTT